MSQRNHMQHDQTYSRLPTTFGFAFAVGTILNFGLVAVQFAYGLHAHSMALIADAGHNLGDALGLLLAWVAHIVARWAPSERYTYGFRSASILAALANAAILLLATGAIVAEAVQRFADPRPVTAPVVMIVAGVAMIVNLVSAYLLRGGGHDLNIRSAFVHLLSDAAVSIGVVVAGAIILIWGWDLVDPVVSLVISGVIIWSTWGLLKNALNLSLQAVPRKIEPAEVRNYLEALPGVSSIHDLHVWAMSTTETALTCHLVMPEGAPGDAFLTQVCEELTRRFAIAHPTIQIELGERVCHLAPAHVV
jgi:cobalt-zinc-cadmium efflux system protein